MKYKHIAIGGTFDLLHLGHKKFIKHAFSIGERVTIGVTSDELVRKLKSGNHQSFSQRFKAVREFVNSNKFLSRATVMQLDDFSGPTLSDKTIDCSLVTIDSLKGAKMINRARVRLGLTDLPVEIFPQVVGTDNKVISTKRIRYGEINQQGLNYYSYLIKKGDLHLPQKLRVVLRKPFGKFIKDLRNIDRDRKGNKLFATVGDYTTQLFCKNGLIPDLSIIDFRIQRVNIYKSVVDLGFSGKEKIIQTVSPPGIISQALSKCIYKSLISIKDNKKIIIIVDGEEDLAVLPTTLMAPLGFSIYYGLRNKGLVEFMVTPNIKDDIFRLLQNFEFN